MPACRLYYQQQNNIMEEIKLTKFSHGGGCGCKIAPDVLENILHTKLATFQTEKLLVGYGTKDDAAVYDLGNGTGVISTVDFFMPMVDDAFDFGRIAAANAISDVFAMGGKPIMATAVLGWPISKLPVEIAQKVIDGARTICNSANIPLAGGHSIDNLEPMFGLSVNGLIELKNLKKNSGAKKGDHLFLTKKLGVGTMATALKRGELKDEHKANMIRQLTSLNSIGEKAGCLSYVNAMTDVTGFGLLGHLTEMAEAANLSAEIDYQSIRVLEGLEEYTSRNIVPDSLYRNWKSHESKVDGIGAFSFFPLNDPQTNGGLLISVDKDHAADFSNFLKEQGYSDFSEPIGLFVEQTDKRIKIKNAK